MKLHKYRGPRDKACYRKQVMCPILGSAGHFGGKWNFALVQLINLCGFVTVYRIPVALDKSFSLHLRIKQVIKKG